MQRYTAKIIETGTDYVYIAEFNKDFINSDNISKFLHNACIEARTNPDAKLSDVLKIMILLVERMEDA